MNPSFSAPLDVKLMNVTAWALYALFAIVTLGIVAAWAMQTSIFAIKKITVMGDITHTNAITLRAYVAPRLRGGFVTLDLARAREIFESVPWVRRAVVKREFPNRLMVQLQEHKAAAYWGADGESRLLNDQGEVFEANTGEVEQDGLPRLNGPQGQGAQVLQAYQSLEPLFADTDMTLDQLELTPRGSWLARLDTGAVLQLGRGTPQEVVARTDRFVNTLTQITSKYGRKPEALESADLRHEGGYAIRIRGVTTTELVQKQK
jgi:cell division protein FtsQ